MGIDKSITLILFLDVLGTGLERDNTNVFCSSTPEMADNLLYFSGNWPQSKYKYWKTVRGASFPSQFHNAVMINIGDNSSMEMQTL